MSFSLFIDVARSLENEQIVQFNWQNLFLKDYSHIIIGYSCKYTHKNFFN